MAGQVYVIGRNEHEAAWLARRAHMSAHELTTTLVPGVEVWTTRRHLFLMPTRPKRLKGVRYFDPNQIRSDLHAGERLPG